MHRILTVFLSLHWVAQFALMAMAAADLGGQLPGGLRHVGSALPVLQLPAMGTGLALALTIGFGLAAVLFLWMLLTALAADDCSDHDADDIARLAFGVATGFLTLVLVLGAGEAAELFPAITLQVAALVASYVAVRVESAFASGLAEEGTDVTRAARAMALGAAHNSMLSRLSGRAGAGEAR